MNELHKHEKCHHVLEHCDHCDVVYCKKCKEEWKKNSFTTTWGTAYTSPPMDTLKFYCHSDAIC